VSERLGGRPPGFFQAARACTFAAMMWGTLGHAPAQRVESDAIRIAVDASRASSQKILHATLQIPFAPGPLTLYYPKWMPADHSPDGPIANLVGLKFSVAGQPVAWRRDAVDMYSFHLEVPAGATSVEAQLDFLLSVPGPTIDFAASSSSRVLVLMWNQVVLYPAGRPAKQIMLQPTLRLPSGWKFNTALPVAAHSGDTVTFAPVDLELLVDSPVQSAEYTKVIPLTAPGEKPPAELDVVADDGWALELPEELIANYKRLVAEAQALYRSHHYRDYHFLLTLSDHVLPLGQEHHESSDDRVGEETLRDPNRRLLEAGLFPHEYTHSWNGQYRRPDGLATSDFQQPMKGELLWVYEGLTSYLGTVLTARSGLWSPEEAREDLAATVSMLEHRVGRRWRPLRDTADAAQILYFAPSEWASERRGTDFYAESVLLWLEVDVTIRRLTKGRRSLDDFCGQFLGGSDGEPVMKPYTYEELLSRLNQVAPNDWRSFFRERVELVTDHPPLGGIDNGGWRMVYNEVPNKMLAAGQQAFGAGNFTSSLGLVVTREGNIQDVIPGMAAFAAGLAPYMRMSGVNGKLFSIEELTRAVEASKSTSQAIDILASNTGRLATYQVKYQGGLQAPHLERVPGTVDYLSNILKPLTGGGVPAPRR